MILRRGFGNAIPVWTRMSNENSFFFAATGAMPAAKIGWLLTAILLYDSTGDMNVRVALQVSDDEESWPSATSFTPLDELVATSDGASFDTQWRSVTLNKKFVRLGFAVRNHQNAGREFAWCALRVETRAP